MFTSVIPILPQLATTLQDICSKFSSSKKIPFKLMPTLIAWLKDAIIESGDIILYNESILQIIDLLQNAFKHISQEVFYLLINRSAMLRRTDKSAADSFFDNEINSQSNCGSLMSVSKKSFGVTPR